MRWKFISQLNWWWVGLCASVCGCECKFVVSSNANSNSAVNYREFHCWTTMDLGRSALSFVDGGRARIFVRRVASTRLVTLIALRNDHWMAYAYPGRSSISMHCRPASRSPARHHAVGHDIVVPKPAGDKISRASAQAQSFAEPTRAHINILFNFIFHFYSVEFPFRLLLLSLSLSACYFFAAVFYFMFITCCCCFILYFNPISAFIRLSVAL